MSVIVCFILKNGMTIAHIAAAKGSVGVVKELMKFNKLVVTTARNRVSTDTHLMLSHCLMKQVYQGELKSPFNCRFVF